MDHERAKMGEFAPRDASDEVKAGFTSLDEVARVVA